MRPNSAGSGRKQQPARGIRVSASINRQAADLIAVTNQKAGASTPALNQSPRKVSLSPSVLKPAIVDMND
jgi:hypothetical protein